MSTAAECPWQPKVWALQDRILESDQVAGTREHLEQCPECRAEYGELTSLSTVLRDGDPAACLPPGPRSRARKALLARCRESAPQAEAPIPAAGANEPGDVPGRWWQRLPVAQAGWAVALGVAILGLGWPVIFGEGDTGRTEKDARPGAPGINGPAATAASAGSPLLSGSAMQRRLDTPGNAPAGAAPGSIAAGAPVATPPSALLGAAPVAAPPGGAAPGQAGAALPAGTAAASPFPTVPGTAAAAATSPAPALPGAPAGAPATLSPPPALPDARLATTVPPPTAAASAKPRKPPRKTPAAGTGQELVELLPREKPVVWKRATGSRPGATGAAPAPESGPVSSITVVATGDPSTSEGQVTVVRTHGPQAAPTENAPVKAPAPEKEGQNP